MTGFSKSLFQAHVHAGYITQVPLFGLPTYTSTIPTQNIFGGKKEREITALAAISTNGTLLIISGQFRLVETVHWTYIVNYITSPTCDQCNANDSLSNRVDNLKMSSMPFSTESIPMRLLSQTMGQRNMVLSCACSSSWSGGQ